jgi:tetratricopeptide (TPR) repeat protein
MPDAERAELDEALREDPQHPQVLTERASLDGKEIEAERLRAIADARKTDFRAWVALARRTPNDLERRLAYQKAAELNPDSAWAQEGTARALVAQGKAKEALAFANRALDLEPWNPNMVEGLAMVARGLGKCEEALQLERRAVRMFLREGNEETRSAASKRLGEMETSCQQAAR